MINDPATKELHKEAIRLIRFVARHFRKLYGKGVLAFVRGEEEDCIHFVPVELFEHNLYEMLQRKVPDHADTAFNAISEYFSTLNPRKDIAVWFWPGQPHQRFYIGPTTKLFDEVPLDPDAKTFLF